MFALAKNYILCLRLSQFVYANLSRVARDKRYLSLHDYVVGSLRSSLLDL